MKQLNSSFLLIFLLITSCSGQSSKEDRIVGGPCEGCEALYEYGESILLNADTIPGFDEYEPKMIVEGTVFQNDGTTPASDVILYFYQTDRNGVYNAGENSIGWGRRHGKHRAWVKTGKDGKYKVYTFRPASYPNRTEPEHIHITLKEEGLIPYYIENIQFRDDPLLTREIISSQRNRAGSGIVRPIEKANYLWIKRDIILGLNIPDY